MDVIILGALDACGLLGEEPARRALDLVEVELAVEGVAARQL